MPVNVPTKKHPNTKATEWKQSALKHKYFQSIKLHMVVLDMGVHLCLWEYEAQSSSNIRQEEWKGDGWFQLEAKSKLFAKPRLQTKFHHNWSMPLHGICPSGKHRQLGIHLVVFGVLTAQIKQKLSYQCDAYGNWLQLAELNEARTVKGPSI